MAQSNEELVRELQEKGAIRSTGVKKAFEKTDRADYFRLLYCLQNSNKCINIKADINLDGKVNSKDLTQWKQYCAGNTGGSPYPSQYPIPSLNPSEYLSQYPLPSNQPTLTPKPF